MRFVDLIFNHRGDAHRAWFSPNVNARDKGINVIRNTWLLRRDNLIDMPTGRTVVKSQIYRRIRAMRPRPPTKEQKSCERKADGRRSHHNIRIMWGFYLSNVDKIRVSRAFRMKTARGGRETWGNETEGILIQSSAERMHTRSDQQCWSGNERTRDAYLQVAESDVMKTLGRRINY